MTAGGIAGPAGHSPLQHGRRPAPRARQREGGSKGGESEGLALQHSAGNSAVSAMLKPTPGDLVRSVVGSEGAPVGGDVVQMVKDTTGADASGIRVHEGPEAADAARAVDAEMFASGNHLVAPEGLDVTTREGAFKTVHEVHHIVNQQAKGPVEGTDTGDGLRISDPGDRHEREADSVAARAVAKHFD